VRTTQIVCGWQSCGDEEARVRATRDAVAQRHRLGPRQVAFAEQRRVSRAGRRGQVRDHRLDEFEQRLERPCEISAW
jgi:hypothetical protein